MKIKRRSFIKKTSYSTTALAVLGTGIGLGEEASNPEFWMKCDLVDKTTAAPLAKVSNTFNIGGVLHRYRLELKATTNLAVHPAYGHDEISFFIEAGTQGLPGAQSPNSGHGNATLYLMKKVGAVWNDVDRIENKLFHDFLSKCTVATGDINTNLTAASILGPVTNNMDPNDPNSEELTLSAQITPQANIKEWVSVTYVLRAKNLQAGLPDIVLDAEIIAEFSSVKK